MASDELDDARVLASLGRILTDGAPFSALPGVDPVTKLFPAPTVDAIRAPLEQAVTDIDESIATLEPAVASLDSLVTAGRLSESNLESTYVSLVAAAKNPDLLIVGAITVDGNDYVTSAAVVWPNGQPGTLTITSRDSTGAVLAYNITYGYPVTKTFTQPTITRNANGAATNVPQIVVT